MTSLTGRSDTRAGSPWSGTSCSRAGRASSAPTRPEGKYRQLWRPGDAVPQGASCHHPRAARHADRQSFSRPGGAGQLGPADSRPALQATRDSPTSSSLCPISGRSAGTGEVSARRVVPAASDATEVAGSRCNTSIASEGSARSMHIRQVMLIPHEPGHPPAARYALTVGVPW
jgi:hypothetical protein